MNGASVTNDMYPVERARALLRHLLLKGGGTPAREVHAAAMRAGVPVWALRKARRTMTIAVRFVGFGPDGRWEWRWEHPPTWRPPAKQEQAAQQVSPPTVSLARVWPPPEVREGRLLRDSQSIVGTPDQARVGTQGQGAATSSADETCRAA